MQAQKSLWGGGSVVLIVAGIPILMAPPNAIGFPLVLMAFCGTIALLAWVPPLTRIFNVARSRVWVVVPGVILLGFGLWLWGMVVYQPSYATVVTYSKGYAVVASFWVLVGLLSAGVDSTTQTALRMRMTNNPVVGLSVALGTVLLMLFIAETSFRYVVRQTDGYSVTFVHRDWYQTYWKPINSYGYRAPEPDFESSWPQLIVSGDSFMAGHGVADYQDVTAGRLRGTLEGEYSVHLVAENGTDTRAQLKRLQAYPVEPDVLVWSYYINDIDSRAGEIYGEGEFLFYPPANPVFQWMERRLYSANFIYWNYLSSGTASDEDYFAGVQNAYADPQVWALHEVDIEATLTWVDEIDARLIVLLWPDLVNLDAFDGALEQVTEAIIEADVNIPVDVVNLTDSLREIPVRARVANPNDSHPSVRAHAVAAERVLDVLGE